ncbi:MAG: hypothetical protein ACK5D5_11900 [Bacteroidota bacterium]|jgi:hypothetical protein
MIQVCPVCKADVIPNIRFPYYLCEECVQKITDRNNEPVIYRARETPLGFEAFYKNQQDKIYLYDLCYLNGKEFKACSNYGKQIFIQPVDFLEYASRPKEIDEAPIDAEKAISKTRGKIMIKQILFPAAVLTFFAVVFPLVSYFIIKKYSTSSVFFNSLILFFLNLSVIFLQVLIIKKVTKRFPNAKYFKQHSWSFLLIGFFLFVFLFVRMLM